MTEKEMEFKYLYAHARRIVQLELDWEVKYDLIFCKAVSSRIFKIVNLDYYDPDTSEEEDVRAFMSACEQKMQELESKSTED